MLTYLYNEKPVTIDAAIKYPIRVAGADPGGNPEVVRLFQNNEDFCKWADQTAHGGSVREILLLLKEKVIPERKNEAWVEQVQRLALNRTQDNLNEFAKLLNCSLRDEEVIRKAMLERTPLIPKMFDPVFLYDREIEHEPPTGAPQDSTTSTLVVPSGFWPDLGWVKWNDRARSVRIFGVIALCENKWFNLFGGRWGWLVGINGLLNLRHISFDRIASSVIAF